MQRRRGFPVASLRSLACYVCSPEHVASPGRAPSVTPARKLALLRRLGGTKRRQRRHPTLAPLLLTFLPSSGRPSAARERALGAESRLPELAERGAPL